MDSASQVFLQTKSGFFLSRKHVLMGVTAICCLVVAIIGIVMIAKSNSATTPRHFSNETECPEGSYDILDKCFEFHSEKNHTWTTAREFCIERGGQLAMVDDCYLMQRMIGMIHSNGLEAVMGYWIGASDTGNEGVWNWLNGQQVTIGSPFWGTQLSGTFQLEPSGKASQNCLQLYGPDYFTFHDGGCSDSKSSICERPPSSDGSCSVEYHKIGGRCFNFVSRKMSWNSAQGNCYSRGAKLAFLKDCHIFGDVVNKIRSSISLSNIRSAWVGGKDDNYENVWTWTDGTTVTMGAPLWGKDEIGPEEPNGGTRQNCAAMMRKDRYFFHDENCLTSLGMSPICQMERKAKYKIE